MGGLTIFAIIANGINTNIFFCAIRHTIQDNDRRRMKMVFFFEKNKIKMERLTRSRREKKKNKSLFNQRLTHQNTLSEFNAKKRVRITFKHVYSSVSHLFTHALVRFQSISVHTEYILYIYICSMLHHITFNPSSQNEFNFHFASFRILFSFSPSFCYSHFENDWVMCVCCRYVFSFFLEFRLSKLKWNFRSKIYGCFNEKFERQNLLASKKMLLKSSQQWHFMANLPNWIITFSRACARYKHIYADKWIFKVFDGKFSPHFLCLAGNNWTVLDMK